LEEELEELEELDDSYFNHFISSSSCSICSFNSIIFICKSLFSSVSERKDNFLEKSTGNINEIKELERISSSG